MISGIERYFEKYTDLYQLAVVKMLGAQDYVVAIIPETFINSNFLNMVFKRIKSITILVENPFKDTENPVCVVCFDNNVFENREVEVYIGDKYINTLEFIKSKSKVKDMKKVDLLIKEFFKEYRMSTLEIYVIDYDLALEKLYYFLRENNQLIMLIEDGVSRYEFLNERENMDNDTSKGQFEKIRDNILEKYNREIPLELLTLLRDRSEFERNCSSHMSSGNYIDFPNDLVLDIHYNKIKRMEILNKLKKLL